MKKIILELILIFGFCVVFSFGNCAQKVIELNFSDKTALTSPNGKAKIYQILVKRSDGGDKGELMYQADLNSRPVELFENTGMTEILWSDKGDSVLINRNVCDSNEVNFTECYLIYFDAPTKKYEIGKLFKEDWFRKGKNKFVDGLGWLDDKTVKVKIAKWDFENNKIENSLEKYYFFNIGKGFAEMSPDEVKEIKKTGTCDSRSDIVGSCFTFYGRAEFYNGSPGLRIWRVGTKRILGVYERIKDGIYENSCAPENLLSVMSWENQVYGNFTVCPLTESKPGEMQTVCVNSVVITKIVDADGHLLPIPTPAVFPLEKK